MSLKFTNYEVNYVVNANLISVDILSDSFALSLSIIPEDV